MHQYVIRDMPEAAPCRASHVPADVPVVSDVAVAAVDDADVDAVVAVIGTADANVCVCVMVCF